MHAYSIVSMNLIKQGETGQEAAAEQVTAADHGGSTDEGAAPMDI